jgi:MtfA peptidase
VLAFALILTALVALAAALMLYPLVRRARRRSLARESLPDSWRAWLTAYVPPYQRMPAALRERLHELVRIFVHEKGFVGCNGLEVTEQMRVAIAGNAGLLLVNRSGVPAAHFYDDLRSILVYPTPFVVRETHHDDDGIVSESEDVLSGQAWDASRIILSWEDIETERDAGYNVVLHEFAHYLDLEDETMDGAPGLGSASAYAEWSRVFQEEFDRLEDDVDAGRETLLDPYAASEPAEFFAVATETFFEQAAELRLRHPGLYEQLQRYYRLDPASWMETTNPVAE